MKTLPELTGDAVGRINDAIEQIKPCLVVGLNSGGHDSLTANYIASLAKRFDGCLHVNTGTGIPATREFVADTCAAMKWPLWEYHAKDNTKADGTPDPMDYEAMCLKHGFPGPGSHRLMYSKLKERQVRRFVRDIGATPATPVLFITGARTEESTRRMGTTNIEPSVRGSSVWINPIHDFTKMNTSELIASVGLKRSPVVDLLHRSGECNCGAFAEEGELAEMKIWDITRPTYEWLINLQARVMAAGFPWGWEEGPPEWWAEKNAGQAFMLGYDEPAQWDDQPLCHNCNVRKLA